MSKRSARFYLAEFCIQDIKPISFSSRFPSSFSINKFSRLLGPFAAFVTFDVRRGEQSIVAADDFIASCLTSLHQVNKLKKIELIRRIFPRRKFSQKFYESLIYAFVALNRPLSNRSQYVSPSLAH